MNKTFPLGSMALFLLGLHAPVFAAAPDVSNVRAAQQVGTKLVQIDYDLSGVGTPVWVTVVGSSDGGATWTLPLASVSGEVGAGITSGRNKRITWNAGADWGGQVSDLVKFRVTAQDTPPAPAGFATIPAGTFTMGSPTDEPGRQSNETEHTVTLTKAFYLQRTEVTWGQWNTVRDWALTNGYTDLPIAQNGYDGDMTGMHPVSKVAWTAAIRWLNAWSEMEGLTPAYSISGAVMRTGTGIPECNFNTNGYRLPTEAEWEYACRATTSSAFYNGEITYPWPTIDPVLDASGWYGRNSPDSRTSSVGRKKDNSFGLFDMHGNVPEWCWDVYAAYPAGPINDPVVNTSQYYTPRTRLVRGGGVDFSSASECRAARRRTADTTFVSISGFGHDGIGFRPARSSVP